MGFYIPWLADAARTTGYKVVEVPGWRTRGHGGMRVLEIVVGHHTATPRTAPGDYPSLNVVTNGRSGLPGPLAQLGLGRDGTIYIIAGGLSYHAGASRWAGFTDLNDESIGIEAESAGDGVWTAAQLDCYPKLVAALLRYMNRGVDRYAAHREVAVPAGRKPDPTGIDSGWMRATAQKYITSGIPTHPLEDDVSADEFWNHMVPVIDQPAMPAKDVNARTNQAAWIAANNTQLILAKLDVVHSDIGELSNDETNIIAATLAAVRSIPGADPETFADALAPVLAPMIQAGATPAQVQEAVRLAFARAGQTEGTPA